MPARPTRLVGRRVRHRGDTHQELAALGGDRVATGRRAARGRPRALRRATSMSCVSWHRCSPRPCVPDSWPPTSRPRRETITPLEEERRRVRRDLHDGLGPRLSGIAFTSDAARNTLRKTRTRPCVSSSRFEPRPRRPSGKSVSWSTECNLLRWTSSAWFPRCVSRPRPNLVNLFFASGSRRQSVCPRCRRRSRWRRTASSSRRSPTPRGTRTPRPRCLSRSRGGRTHDRGRRRGRAVPEPTGPPASDWHPCVNARPSSEGR